MKQLLNYTTKLRVQTTLDSRLKVSIRKMSTYGGKQAGSLGPNPQFQGTRKIHCGNTYGIYQIADLLVL